MDIHDVYVVHGDEIKSFIGCAIGSPFHLFTRAQLLPTRQCNEHNQSNDSKSFGKLELFLEITIHTSGGRLFPPAVPVVIFQSGP
jgi:hypothetical protein